MIPLLQVNFMLKKYQILNMVTHLRRLRHYKVISLNKNIFVFVRNFKFFFLIAALIFSCKRVKLSDRTCQINDWRENMKLLYIENTMSKNDYFLLKYYVMKMQPNKVCCGASFAELLSDARIYQSDNFEIHRYPIFLPENLMIRVINDSNDGFYGPDALSFRVQVENFSDDAIPITKMHVRFFSPLGRLFCIAGYKIDTIVEGGHTLEVSRRFNLNEVESYLNQDNFQFWDYESKNIFYSNIKMDCQFD